MLNIIKQNNKQFVNARELYLKLKGIEKDESRKFTAFFKIYVLDYGFEEGKDFAPLLAQTKEGRPETNYMLSLDCAKQVSMVQRTPQGKAIRDYLLELDNKVETGALIEANTVIDLIDLVRCFGILEYREEAQSMHMTKFDEAWKYWQMHAQSLGYTKDSLKEALSAINIKYVNMQNALMKLDKTELIRKSIFDLLCALGKSIEYALNISQLAKEIASKVDIRFDSLKSVMFLASLPDANYFKKLTQKEIS